MALDLGSIGASATKIGANSIRSYNDAQKTIYTNLTDANVPIQYEATVAKDVKSTPNTTPIKEKPKEMALEDYGRDFAIFNGEKVTPQVFNNLYHGTRAEVLGLPETSTIDDMIAHVFNNGLPARKKDIDLGKHQNSNPETAFRGTTIEPVSQIGNAGAAHWAKDGGIVIHIKDQKGYDLNELHATSNTGGGIGGMVNQAVYSGEFEIAIPAYVKPEDIARIGYVDETGRFPQVIFTPREDFLKQVEKNVKK